jgi:hypothetical protein
MASGLYSKGKEGLLDGSINLETDTIKAALVDTGTYAVNLSTHQYLSDVSGIVGTDQTLASKTFTNGTFDAADSTWTSVTGNSVEAIVLYKSTGNAATSRLIGYWDGLSVTPNGGNIIAQWNASGLFSI